MTQVTVAQLKVAADLLLSHLESSGVKTIEITDDFYWDVPASRRYDQYDEPTQHTVGQLSEDLSELQRMLAGETPALGYGLVWLAALLRRVGETSTG